MRNIGNIIFLSTLIYCNSCDKIDDKLFTSLNSNDTKIIFQNTLKSTANLNILNYLYYYNGAGVSASDFNNDGLCDLYFAANQTNDKLYLNKGNFIFEDVTELAGINNASNWTSGSTVVDINNDGLLDIYICKLGSYNGIEGNNLLYVNQGLKNGVPVFVESAHVYGLDIKSFSTQAVFFDYDLDDDLDMFLLNHSTHPNTNYSNGNNRMQKDSLSGDMLFENIEGYYVDVSLKSGIFQGKIGYGLGVSVSDINNDGYPDIYVGNDFFENDYLYINQQDKTFKEVISNDKTILGHTSHYSMGNSINDLNNDGLMDIVSLDMLPENLETYKTSGLEYPYQIYEYYLKNGYAPQFMQNTLHLNRGNGLFSESAFLSGIAATEWSWNPIVADFDNDGYKDLYVTNGIPGATNDMDFINFISNENIQKQLGKEMSEKNLALANQIPAKKVTNYVFKNHGDNAFEDVTKLWSPTSPSYSNGGVCADLDNDGDLDLAINNINEPPFILRNNSEKNKKNNYLNIRFQGSKNNLFGIGAKVIAYVGNQTITSENYLTKGYLSSVEPILNLGFGTHKSIDSLTVVWPNKSFQTFENIEVNQELKMDIKNARGNYYSKSNSEKKQFLTNVNALFNFKHNDPVSIEFNRDPLIPFASTNCGPQISTADINNDGLDDIFVCGAKMQPGQLLIQNSKHEFLSVQNELLKEDEKSEDTYSVFFDANGDEFVDLLVVSGGNEFKTGTPLQPRLYINQRGIFVKDTSQFNTVSLNASKVTAVDTDNDGDLDISISSNLIPWEFGKTPSQYIFENNGKGAFKEYHTFYGNDYKNIGNVQDVIWVDINGDSLKDVIVCGYWMPISVFINTGKGLILSANNNFENSNGWWNCIKAADFDNDGDVDIIAGNWGLNTRLKASHKEPLTLYSNDFDDNGTIDPVITYFYQGKETPFASKDELAKQLPFLNKKYLSYKDFAKANFSELLPKNKIRAATKKQVFELASCYFENLGDNTFKKRELPMLTQLSSINDMEVTDFNNDGFLDVFLVGNNYEISTHLGKLDASHGAVLLNDKSGFFTYQSNQKFDVPGPARHIQKVKVNNVNYYFVSINNGSPIFLKHLQ